MHIPKFRRAFDRSVEMLILLTKASPKVASSVPHSIPIVVDLPVRIFNKVKLVYTIDRAAIVPAPFAPKKLNISPDFTSKFIPFTAAVPSG